MSLQCRCFVTWHLQGPDGRVDFDVSWPHAILGELDGTARWKLQIVGLQVFLSYQEFDNSDLQEDTMKKSINTIMFKLTYIIIYIYTPISITLWFTPFVFFWEVLYLHEESNHTLQKGSKVWERDGSITKSTPASWRLKCSQFVKDERINGFDVLTVFFVYMDGLHMIWFAYGLIWYDMVWLKNYLHRSIGSLWNYLQGVNTSQVVRNVSVAISEMLPLMPKKMTRFSPGEAW